MEKINSSQVQETKEKLQWRKKKTTSQTRNGEELTIARGDEDGRARDEGKVWGRGRVAQVGDVAKGSEG